jgi:hypothetical protein
MQHKVRPGEEDPVLTWPPLYAICGMKGMNPKKAAVVVLLAAFLSGSPGRAQDPAGPKEIPPEPRPFGPLEKSLLIPGWGQFSVGRPVEGALFLGATVLCLIGALDNNHRGKENYALYRAAANRDDAAGFRSLTERYDRRRNQFLLAGAAVWALNLLDIALIVKSGDRSRRSWTIRIGQDFHEAFVVGAGYHF